MDTDTVTPNGSSHSRGGYILGESLCRRHAANNMEMPWSGGLAEERRQPPLQGADACHCRHRRHGRLVDECAMCRDVRMWVLTPLPTLTGGFDVQAKHVTKEVSVCLLPVYLFVGVGRGTPRNALSLGVPMDRLSEHCAYPVYVGVGLK